MPLIILDGPEKAGKTTIANAIIARYGGRLRRWGRVESDVEYLQPLIEDCAAVIHGETIVWDRGWAAEHVYGKLLNRDRRLSNDAWLGEWLYGRAAQSLGLRAMILGPSVEELQRRRDATDLPVDPREERETFNAYAHSFGWMRVVQQHTPESLAQVVADLWNTAMFTFDDRHASPPAFVGPPSASVVVVAERRNEASNFPGAWLPLTTPLTMKFARMFPRPFQAAWTNMADCPPQALRHASTIVVLGDKARKWIKYHVAASQRVIALAHPAYMFRFNTDAARRKLARMTAELDRLKNGGVPHN